MWQCCEDGLFNTCFLKCPCACAAAGSQRGPGGGVEDGDSQERRLIYASLYQKVAAKNSTHSPVWLSHVRRSEFGEDTAERRLREKTKQRSRFHVAVSCTTESPNNTSPQLHSIR